MPKLRFRIAGNDDHVRAIINLLRQDMDPAAIVLERVFCHRPDAAQTFRHNVVGHGTNMHALSAVLQRASGQ